MNTPPSPPLRRGTSIQRLLLVVNAFALLVPLLAVTLMRLYEAHLVQTTERRLIAESVLIGEAWRARLLTARGIPPDQAPRIQPLHVGDERFFPIEPVIDLANPRQQVLPPQPGIKREIPPADRVGPEWWAGAEIKPFLDRAKLVNLSGARVLNAEGCVVASSGPTVGQCLDELPEVDQALKGRYHAVARQRISDEPAPDWGSISRRGAVRVFTATPLLANGEVIGVVRMSRTSRTPARALWDQRYPLLAGLVGCLLLTLGITLFLARTITRPVRAITRAAQDIAAGRARAPLTPGGRVPAEVYALSEALDTMKGTLEARATYIAEFASNVSHELKTPLTSVRGAVELLQSSAGTMSPEQRNRFLDNIAAATERMTRQVSRLLHLARIEHTREAEEAIPLRPWLEGCVRRYQDQAEVHLDLAADTPEKLHIPPEHLESVVGNLLDNAVRHGAGQPVHLKAQRADSKVCIEVIDHGPGISEANQRRLFERFFTTERDRGGTGLGLAIVQAVARSRGGEVSFKTGPEGTTFRVVL